MTKTTTYQMHKFVMGILSLASFTIILMLSSGCATNPADVSRSLESSQTTHLTPFPLLQVNSPVPNEFDSSQPVDSSVVRSSPENTGCPIPPHVQFEFKGAQKNSIFAWSPDSKEIGLTVQFGYQQSAIFHFTVEELLQTRQAFIPIVPSFAVNEYDFSWSPYSNAMALVSQYEAGIGNTAYWATDIYLMSIEDATRTLLVTGERYFPNAAPNWSRDGRMIAFIAGQFGRLYAIPVSGGEKIQVSTVFARHHTWSPDSSRLAYTGFIPMESPPNFSRSYLYIFTVDANGQNERNLTTNFFCSLVPNWSPDGQNILFESYQNEQWDLYVMEQDGTELINLTNDSRYDYDGDWSPDGQQVVFASYNSSPEIDDPMLVTGSEQELFLTSVDGSEIIQLTNTPDEFELSPAWSPDGQYIAFLVYDGKWHLDLIRPDGTERFRLISFPE